MKVYAATSQLGGNDIDTFRKVDQGEGYPSLLISYLYDTEGDYYDSLGYMPRNNIGDSGAFSVWTKGETVNLDDYIVWCKHNLARGVPGFLPISLDVIPGAPGRAPTKRERSNAMRESLENGDRLRAADLPIMEVFHWHEPLSHLDKLIERRQTGEIVGVGGLAGPGSRPEKLAFISSVFNRVRPKEWKGLVPLHGLGIGPDSKLCYPFPWWSVDSSTWVKPGKFGSAVNKDGRNGGSDPRAKNREMRGMYIGRLLESWLTREQTLTSMWERRGVTWSE